MLYTKKVNSIIDKVEEHFGISLKAFSLLTSRIYGISPDMAESLISSALCAFLLEDKIILRKEE